MPKTNNIPELVSPRKPKIGAAPPGSPDRINMNEHFFNAQCLSCGDPASQSNVEKVFAGLSCSLSIMLGLCNGCFMTSQETISNLGFRIRAREERLANAHRICGTCTTSSPEDPIQCESLDCPWFYSRRKAEEAMDLVPILAELSDDLEKEMENKAEEESEAEIDLCDDEDFYMSDSDATIEV
jgi:DNA polymerase zeta